MCGARRVHHPELLGSATAFRGGLADARRSVPVGDEETAAFRGYREVAGGDVPVLMLPALGGTDLPRGYLEGQPRDRVTECRGRIRLDEAVGRRGSGLYLTLGEGF